MKKSFYTVGSLIILLICAFVFVILPAMVGGENRNQDIPVYGKYKNKEIRCEQGSDMLAFVQNLGEQYSMYGYDVNDSTISYYIYNSAFNQTVSKMIIEEMVEKSGYKAPKSAVTRQMISAFSDANGNYSKKLYNSTPESVILELRDKIEDELIEGRFSDDNFSSATLFGSDALFGLKESSNELDFLVELGEEKRGFDMISYKLSDYPDEAKVSYGKSNVEKFIKYDVSIITVNEESEAKNVLKRLNSEEITFDDAVSIYSEKFYSGDNGQLNSPYAYQIMNMMDKSDDAAAVMALSSGELSGIIQTKYGYSIFKGNGPAENPDFSSEDMIRTVYSYLTSYENSTIENYLIAKANDFRSSASMNGFEKACEDNNLEMQKIDPFPLNYGNAAIAASVNTSNPALTGADTNENFLKKVFSLKENEVSEPVVVGEYVVVAKYNPAYVDESEPVTVLDQIPTMDEESASSVIMSNPNLVNDFATTYFKLSM